MSNIQPTELSLKTFFVSIVCLYTHKFASNNASDVGGEGKESRLGESLRIQPSMLIHPLGRRRVNSKN